MRTFNAIYIMCICYNFNFNKMSLSNLQITVKKQKKTDNNPITITFNQLLFQNSTMDEEARILLSNEITSHIDKYVTSMSIINEHLPKKKAEVRMMFLQKEMQCLKLCSIHNSIRIKEFYLYIIWEKLDEKVYKLFQQFGKLLDIDIVCNKEQLSEAIKEQVRPLNIGHFEDKSGLLINKLDDFKDERIVRVICEYKKEHRKVLSHIVAPKYSQNAKPPSVNYTKFYNTIDISNKIRQLFSSRSPSISIEASQKSKMLSHTATSSVFTQRAEKKEEYQPLWPLKMNRVVYRCFSESLSRKIPVSLVNLRAHGNTLLSAGKTPKTIWISPYLMKVKLAGIKCRRGKANNASMKCNKCVINEL